MWARSATCTSSASPARTWPEVAVTHRYHATLNPDSVMGRRGEITVDDVLSSRMICSPAAPARLRHRQRRRLRHRDRVRGGGQELPQAPGLGPGRRRGRLHRLLHHDPRPVVPRAGQGGAPGRPTWPSTWPASPATTSTWRACTTASPSPCCGTWRRLGFCKLGEGAAYFAEGHTRLGGSMPCNTDGGLLSNSHCGRPVRACTPSRSSASCAASAAHRQVPRPKIGLSLAQGLAVHGWPAP